MDTPALRSIRRPGVTLVELAIVMALLGIVYAFAAPNIDVAGLRASAGARSLATHMLAAQALAVKRQHQVIVAVDTAAATLQVHEDTDNDGVLDTGERVRAVPLDEGVVFGRGGAPAFRGHAAAAELPDAAGSLPAVGFLRNGSATGRAVVYTTSQVAAAQGTKPEHAHVVVVDRATGRVGLHRYGAGAWVREL